MILFFLKDLRTRQEVTETDRLELADYVDIVRDVLKLKKNLRICRRFYSLNKETLKASPNPIYIDVWSVRSN